MTPACMTRDELIAVLRTFDAGPLISCYRRERLAGLSQDELLLSVFGNNIARAFHHETPSQRYRRWRRLKDAGLFFRQLNAIESQEEFDRFAFGLGASLVADWGTTDNCGGPTRMNIGVAMKIVNLALKHSSFSEHGHNPRLTEWLHVPWDKFTLTPLRRIRKEYPRIPYAPSFGFVRNQGIYVELHSLITDIAREAGVDRIVYELWAWDRAHQQ